jgi:hypothetical protein
MYIPARDSGHVPAASLDYGGDEKRIDNILLGVLLLPEPLEDSESPPQKFGRSPFSFLGLGTLLRPLPVWPGFWLSPGFLTERWGV